MRGDDDFQHFSAIFSGRIFIGFHFGGCIYVVMMIFITFQPYLQVEPLLVFILGMYLHGDGHFQHFQSLSAIFSGRTYFGFILGDGFAL